MQQKPAHTCFNDAIPLPCTACRFGEEFYADVEHVGLLRIAVNALRPTERWSLTRHVVTAAVLTGLATVLIYIAVQNSSLR